MTFKELIHLFTDDESYCRIKQVCKVDDYIFLDDIPDDKNISAVYKQYNNIWLNLNTNEELDNNLKVVDYFNDTEKDILYIVFAEFTNRDWLGTLTNKQLQYVLDKVYGYNNIFCDNINTFIAQYEWLKSPAEGNYKTEYLKKELKDVDKYLEESM